MSLIIVGLSISVVVRKGGNRCCVCDVEIPVSKVRPNTTALCVTSEKSYVSCLCHRCAGVSWINTYSSQSLELLQFIPMWISQPILSDLLGKTTNEIAKFFVDYNREYSITLFGMVSESEVCQQCGNNMYNRRYRCKRCVYAIYCSKRCLVKNKARHKRFLCDSTFFVATRIYL